MKLRNKLIIIVAGLIIIASVIIIIILNIGEKKILRQQIHNRLETAAQSRAHHIDTFLEINKETIKQLSESITIEQFLLTEKNDPVYKKRFYNALRRLKYTEEILYYTYDIIILNKNGIVAAASHNKEIDKDKSYSPYFAGAKEGSFIRDAYFSKDLQKNCIAFSAPILNEDNSVFLGVVVQRISLEKINQIVQDKTGLGESGDMYLINKDNFMITPSRFKENTFLRQKIDNPESREWKELSVQEEIIERKEIDIYTAYHGEMVLGTHYRIKSIDWLLMAEISEKEAFAPLGPIRQCIALLFLILLLLGLSLFLMVSRTIIKPIITMFYGTKEIRRGNLSYRIHSKSTDELGQLAAAFDEMAAALQEYRDDLKEKVAVRTKELTVKVNELHESEEKFYSISASAQDAVIMIDTKGRVTYWNAAAERIFGYSEEEAAGKDLHKLIMPPIYLKEFKKGFALFCETGKGAAFGKVLKLKALRKDRSEFPVEISISPIKIKGNWHAAAMIRDITEKKHLEEQLFQSQKLESIGQLAGGIAHDFNNILTAINGYTEMAMMNLENDKESHAYQSMTHVLNSGQKAENLVRQLLAFSRKQIIQPKLIDPNKAISDLQKMLVRMIGEDIKIKLFLADNIIPILADSAQLEQIVINLVINARDAINLKTQRASEKEIILETALVYLDEKYISSHVGSSVGQHILFSFSDNGIGMDEQIINNIFEPFFTTKELGKGTGLGLSTVYGIVKQNKGSIYVYSEKGEGTTFKIYWPCVESIISPEQERKEKEKIKGGKEIILFVEDDEKVRDISISNLRSYGYKVYGAANGREALKMVHQKNLKMDLLVTDLVMPEMNGKELAAKLEELFPGLKIIFSSGYTDNHIIQNGKLKAGLNFLPKPYSLTALAKRAREILDEIGK